MKKLLFLLVPFMVLIFSFNSKCASQEDINNLKTAFYNKFGETLGDTFATNVIDKWETVKTSCPYLYCQKISTSYGFRWGTAPTVSGQYWNCSGYQMSAQPANYTGTITFISSTMSNMNTSQNNGFYVGPYDSWHTVPIDWDNPYYSANITAPKMNINYRELSSVPIVDVPLNITKNANDTIQNVYIEMYATFYMPTEIFASYDPRNGQYEFSGYPTNSVTWGGVVIAPEDMKTWQTASADFIHLALVDIWEDCYNMVNPNDITWHFASLVPESAYDSIKNKYLDMRKVNCFYGSNCIINARYFTIVNETQYVVGSWTNWKSYSPYTFTETLPSYYIPLVQASGTENNTYDVQVPTEIEPGTGSPTGVYTDPNINITVTQNVPNYPDYPTIVSYNKDNLLVDTMNWAENLQGFFGEFGSFLEVSFAFIPGWIWAIIGFGFSLSIVVMFLKIL